MTGNAKSTKSSTGLEYEDYFQSKFHERRLSKAMKKTVDGFFKVGRDVGTMEAISEVQGVGAAVAHFYHSMGMPAQGAAFLRGLAKQIETDGNEKE